MTRIDSATRSVLAFGRMIKFSHTIFALPFALTSVVLASQFFQITWQKIFWIIAAMAGARSAAMGFNRIADAALDSRNPRTKEREIPRGVINTGQAGVFVILASALLLVASYELNELCFKLSPLALAIVFFYSFTKRFTSWAHVFLGMALGVAPLGAWMAITGEWHWYPFLLGCGVLAWVAGFDIIYACQDYEFDRSENLFSIPRTFGIAAALWISRIFHALSFSVLLTLGYLFHLSWIYYCGVGVVGVILLYEQSLVKATDLSKVNLAFFNMNGIISLIYFFFTAADVMLK
jgi:4-hydroxybenzoate polyprenyltransferase